MTQKPTLKPECNDSLFTRFVFLPETQEILKSLVAAPIDGTELGQESGPTPYHPDPALKTHPMLPMQFHSFDRSAIFTGGNAEKDIDLLALSYTHPSADQLLQSMLL